MESNKTAIVSSLKAVKHNSGKTYGQIAAETDLTNVYVAQLFKRQARLNPETAPKLRSALPQLPEELIQEMMQPPWRSYDPNLIQEPTVYRLNEAVMHFGESIKDIINEEFGDGIMSAIDFYCSVDKVKGVDGKDRVVVTFDGKYLPYTEQSQIRTPKMESQLKAVKHNSGETYGQIAAETGLTNVYIAQLFKRQARLNPETAPKLRSALPQLPEELIQEMMLPPMRSYDPNLIQDPTVYRLNEAVMHFGESIKEIINKEFGDGIMSAIDFYCSVDKVKGVDGKDRVVLTFDGKYLPYTEQKTEHMVSRSRLQEK